jgi:hypothetical protein
MFASGGTAAFSPPRTKVKRQFDNDCKILWRTRPVRLIGSPASPRCKSKHPMVKPSRPMANRRREFGIPCRGNSSDRPISSSRRVWLAQAFSHRYPNGTASQFIEMLRRSAHSRRITNWQAANPRSEHDETGGNQITENAKEELVTLDFGGELCDPFVVSCERRKTL